MLQNLNHRIPIATAVTVNESRILVPVMLFVEVVRYSWGSHLCQRAGISVQLCELRAAPGHDLLSMTEDSGPAP